MTQRVHLCVDQPRCHGLDDATLAGPADGAQLGLEAFLELSHGSFCALAEARCVPILGWDLEPELTQLGVQQAHIVAALARVGEMQEAALQVHICLRLPAHAVATGQACLSLVTER